jgi:preprotein translocase subunit SecA
MSREILAEAREAIARTLGLSLYPTQLRAAEALLAGKIVEMPTGEGKTVAAVPAIAALAQERRGVHVWTANDYLAARDQQWMAPVYAALGLSVASISQHSTPEQRRDAYRADVTYLTPHECGYDYLRDSIALHPEDTVQRPFHAVVIDEADSILIDEARIPLVIATESNDLSAHLQSTAQAARALQRGVHFHVESDGQILHLTDDGIDVAESLLACENLYADPELLDSLQNALHAEHLLRRDVDYLVTTTGILPIDDYKGRTMRDRRWPAGLHAALETKEGLPPRREGRILTAVSLQNLTALYPFACGMTGTAATQSEEFRLVYGLEVEVIPPHRPCIRVDHPDRLFRTKAGQYAALLDEIAAVHATGQPLLVATRTVEEAQQVSAQLPLPHHLLTAKNEAEEAAVIARAGEVGRITVSTNMAGRGVDIVLGPGAAERGGLCVLGVGRNESRRIDNQLRGRAGRQGDPGSSRFFVSYQDDLITNYLGVAEANPDDVQRMLEGRHLDLRLRLRKYEHILEAQRLLHAERRLALTTPEEKLHHDDLWSQHLERVTQYRAGLHFLSYSGADPLREYLRLVHDWFEELALQEPDLSVGPRSRGATWTYLSTDQPFGTPFSRLLKNMLAALRAAGQPPRQKP